MNDLEAEFPDLLSNVYCGIELPPGWVSLVRELCRHLSRDFPDARVSQIKSKFGKLRCYVDCAPVAAYRLIDEYERRSATVCEVCGGCGSQVGKGWIRTLCMDCEHDR